MSFERVSAIFSEPFLRSLRNNPVGLIDIGARDDIGGPWKHLETLEPGALRVIGFEADPEEQQRLAAAAPPNRRYYPCALWERNGPLLFHIAEIPACSSVHPPNQEFNRLFSVPGQGTNMATPRQTVRTIMVEARRLDDALVDCTWEVDILKLDTQGAEYEILMGAPQTLGSAFAVLAETWTVEVHKGQKLFFDVARLCVEHGFEFMTYELAGLASRSAFNDGLRRAAMPPEAVLMRHQVSSLELLFFKPPEAYVRSCANFERAVKAAAVADLYGFPDHAFDVLRLAAQRWPDRQPECQEMVNVIVRNRFNVLARGLTQAELTTALPSLHY